jgi:hypothetical protein
VYEGTVVSFEFLSLNYGISWDDGDYLVDNSVVTINMIENWLVKTGQVSARARIQAGAPFALMVFHHDSLERKTARSGAFHFLSQSITLDSHSSFVTTCSQHLFSPQNSNNASSQLLTKSSSCARAFSTVLIRYIFSETMLASCLNYCSCMEKFCSVMGT